MKKIIFTLSLALSTYSFAQLQSPMLSPLAKMEQTIGLTKVNIEYSRPQKANRTIFPTTIPYGQVWRAGANKNSILSTDDNLIFGKDTLKAGSYAMYITPEANEWTLIFYKTTDNWGTPAEFSKEKVALEVKTKVAKNIKPVESFTIQLENVTINGAVLTFAWDNITSSFPFQVTTDAKMKNNIAKAFAGPSAGEYYKAADYILNANGDMNDALTYISKAVEMAGNDNAPFFYLRKKALIQANLKDYKGAIETATSSLEAAKKVGNDEFVRLNEASIKEWNKSIAPDKKKLFGNK